MEMKLDALGLIAADIQATKAFYERLGCTFGDGPIHFEADLGTFRLMLDSESSMRENGFLTGPLGERNSYALAVQCDSAETVDAAYAKFAADGFGVTQPFDAPWGQRYSTVHDPDGTHVDLYAWLPGQSPN
jgi:uncharacterized glyoxalase superfamily protein PhnB